MGKPLSHEELQEIYDLYDREDRWRQVIKELDEEGFEGIYDGAEAQFFWRTAHALLGCADKLEARIKFLKRKGKE